MIQLIRIIVLRKLDPAGGAGGDHRQNALVLYTLYELVGFLNNGQISAEVGVKHLIKTQTAQCRDHFAFHVGADRHTERFAQGRTNGGSRGHDHVLGRIRQRFPNGRGAVGVDESAGGADGNALTAGYARHVAERLIECTSNVRVDTAIVRADDRYVLLAADSYAAAAQDTFVVVAYKVSGGLIQLVHRTVTVKFAAVLNAVILAHLLQLAVGGAFAGQAFLFVGREDQLQRGLAGFLHASRVGLDLHTFRNRIHASGNQTASTGGFYHADTASADLVDILQIAQGGNLHTGLTGGLQNGGTLGDANGNAVYFYIYHFHDRHTPSSNFADSLKLTVAEADTALDTLFGVDGVGRQLVTGCDIIRLGDGADRAVAGAQAAADTLILVNDEGQQIFADTGGALLVHNVSNVFVTEEAERGQNRVGSGLT